jgi:YHS domain-containing protein
VIRRLLGLALLVLAVMWWLRRLRASFATQQPQGRAGASNAGREAAPLVRDRVCNTFLPRSRALTLRAGGAEHHFCSETCRAKFLETTEIRPA